jgi:signal transduction histidine kinase|tara:strand:+ start:2332 stop:3603 length:1272 start_codon:yes stop_codon:yes gene_type:complete
MKYFLKKIGQLGSVEDYEVKNNRLILFLIGPIMFVYSYYIQNTDDDSIRIKGAKVVFALLFLIASFCPFIFKKTIYYFYGWMVFLLMLFFSHYLLIHLALNSFHLRFILGFYAVVFGSILLFNKTTFINIYLLTIFIHLFHQLMVSQIDYSIYKAVLGSFTLIVVFGLVLLNDSRAHRTSLAKNSRVLEKNKIELKERAEELQEKKNDLSDFSGVVSHDLKTPLGNVLALFSWVKEDLKDNNIASVEQHLKLIEKEVVQLDLILEGVLNYSLQNEVTSTNEKVNLDKLVNDLKEFNENKNCSITIKSKLPIIEINKGQITQVFENLIENAIKYNSKKVCKIEIDCALKNKIYTFSITDNGMGIEQKFHKKIFELFQKLAIEKSLGSTGIGLSVVKKIVKINKGEVYLKSKLRKGTTFYFTLPI